MAYCHDEIFSWRCGAMTVIDKVYKSGEVMKMLNLKESVFKKYYLALEKEGYMIQKNSAGHRVFTEKDIQTLETLMKLIQYDGMTIESVAKKIGAVEGHSVTTEEKQNKHDVTALIEIALEAQRERFELQMKQHEQQLIEKMQDSLETQLKLQEREIAANFKSEFIKFKDSLEETLNELLTEKPKPWWKKFL